MGRCLSLFSRWESDSVGFWGVTGPTVFSFVMLSGSRSFTFCNDGGHEKTQVECVQKWQIEDLDTWQALVDEKWTVFSLWSFSCCLQWACWVKWYPWLAFPDNLSNSLKPLVTGSPAKQAGYWLFYSFMLGNTNFPLTKLEEMYLINSQLFLLICRLLTF